MQGGQLQDEQALEPPAGSVRSLSPYRELYSVNASGGPRNVTDWLPKVPLWGGQLHGETLRLWNPEPEDAWESAENGTLVRQYLMSYDAAVGDWLEGSLHVSDEGATGLLMADGERDYEVRLTFHDDGTVLVEVDAPTWDTEV